MNSLNFIIYNSIQFLNSFIELIQKDEVTLNL